MQKTSTGRFDEKTAAHIVGQLCVALQYLHANSIVHRDIKPENILLDSDGNIKLADFGWSNYLDSSNSKRSTYCGTLDYLAPEMADSSHKHDHRVDIWSVGVLTYEMLAGYAPFSLRKPTDNPDDVEHEIKQKIISSKFNFPSTFPPLAKDLVKKILMIRPDDRLSLTAILEHPWIVQMNKNSPQKKPKKASLSRSNSCQDPDFLEFIKRKSNPKEVQEDPSYIRSDFTFTVDEILKYLRPESILSLSQSIDSPGRSVSKVTISTSQSTNPSPFLSTASKTDQSSNVLLKKPGLLKPNEEIFASYNQKQDNSGITGDTFSSQKATLVNSQVEFTDLMQELSESRSEIVELKKEVGLSNVQIAKRDLHIKVNEYLRIEIEAAHKEIEAARKKEVELVGRAAGLLARNVGSE